MYELATRKIPVVFCDERHLPVAESLPLHGPYNGLAQLKSQLGWSVPLMKRVWQHIVKDKIRLQAQLLERRRNHCVASRLIEYADSVRSGDLDNREAVAAAAYFSALFGEDFTRDTECATNDSLNYGYSIMLSTVACELSARGYLTQLGIHHRGELNPWNLASDLMEPFRPYVDKIVIESGFESLDQEARHRLAGILLDEVRYDNGVYKLQTVVRYYVRDCLDALNRKVPVSDIKCYRIE